MYGFKGVKEGLNREWVKGAHRDEIVKLLLESYD